MSEDREARVLDDGTGREPVTVGSLRADLEQLGLSAGATVLVHTSLSKLGWVLGGPQAVIEALQAVIGDQGTLMMPTHSAQLSDPRYWENPPVPKRWWPNIREQMPAYNAELTPTRAMGAVAELFRTQPGVQRSPHPHGSFAAIGLQAQALTAEHALDSEFGEHSPLARLYELDGQVLLLGVDHANNTSLHLAEHRALGELPRPPQGAPMVIDGERRWIEFAPPMYDSSDFQALGEAYTKQHPDSARQAVGWGSAQLVSQRSVVDFAVTWLQQHRQ